MVIHIRGLVRITGFIFIIMGIALLLPVAVGLAYEEVKSVKSFIAVAFSSAAIGLAIITLTKSTKQNLRPRDGYLIVALVWILSSLIASIPYVLEGCIPSFVDAFFESTSGFSTTGASILKDVEALPKSMLFWRSFAHWLGGMGILVFTVALMPYMGIGGQIVVNAETTGPTLVKVVPKTSDMAKHLYTIYVAFTLIQTTLLMLGGLSFFDAITHTFATVGTGGFSNYNASIAAFNSRYVEGVIVLFMILSGISFNLYILAAGNGLRVFLRDSEFKLYLIAIGLSTFLIGIYFAGAKTYETILEGFRHAIFQCVSIMTTTGYATADYNKWPTFAMMILLILFFVGGCSSSTAGGVKVIRILIMIKLVKRLVALKLHPNALVTIKVDRRPLQGEAVQGVASFAFLYFLLVMVLGLLVSIDGYDLVTSMSAAASCLGNIGPGFSQVGPANNYADFSDPVKLLLSLAMIGGRLELFTLLMLFYGKYWNPNA